jgi:thiamine biosynthesis lipoprotein
VKASISRRARPLLGTLVEVGGACGLATLERAFAEIGAVQAALSRFEPGSEVARFNALGAGEAIEIGPLACSVLSAAERLARRTDGRFDVALGSGRWMLRGRRWIKLDDGVSIDLGGIAKGHAIDRAILALQAAGCPSGWVNAGGDLRVYGELTLRLQLRDEARGGVRDFGSLHQAAFATSRFAPGGRSTLAGGDGRPCHLSVRAPTALWADALTKVAALGGGAELLEEFGAQVWRH